MNSAGEQEPAAHSLRNQVSPALLHGSVFADLVLQRRAHRSEDRMNLILSRHVLDVVDAYAGERNDRRG